jgi:hypothetical protein
MVSSKCLEREAPVRSETQARNIFYPKRLGRRGSVSALFPGCCLSPRDAAIRRHALKGAPTHMT